MQPEVRKIFNSFFPGMVFITVIGFIFWMNEALALDLNRYGMRPRALDGWYGILTYPLLHKDLEHYFSNAVPLFILIAMLRFFYQDISNRVFLFSWLLGGVWLWLGGRDASVHIGASGIVYALAAFLFFSGIWRMERRTLAVSFIVVFLYGGMVWGVFPWFKDRSWEGHLFGGMAGLLLSWIYRKSEPQRKRYDWEDEPDEDERESTLSIVRDGIDYSSNMKKIEHIGIAVKSLELSNSLFTRILNTAPYKTETVESEHVATSFFMTGTNKIELLEATDPQSAIAKFIEKKGEGIHHIAFEVDDILTEMRRLEQEGFTLLNKEPKKGADNKLICFVHPRETNGVLIELCQEIR